MPDDFTIGSFVVSRNWEAVAEGKHESEKNFILNLPSL